MQAFPGDSDEIPRSCSSEPVRPSGCTAPGRRETVARCDDAAPVLFPWPPGDPPPGSAVVSACWLFGSAGQMPPRTSNVTTTDSAKACEEETAKAAKAARQERTASGCLSVGQGQVGARPLEVVARRTALALDTGPPFKENALTCSISATAQIPISSQALKGKAFSCPSGQRCEAFFPGNCGYRE